MLDRSVEDPVDLYVGDRLIARGILEEQDGENAGQLQVRLTEVADLQGEVIRMGQQVGLPTPINALVAELIQVAELAGEGLPHLPLRAIRAEL